MVQKDYRKYYSKINNYATKLIKQQIFVEKISIYKNLLTKQRPQNQEQLIDHRRKPQLRKEVNAIEETENNYKYLRKLNN